MNAKDMLFHNSAVPLSYAGRKLWVACCMPYGRAREEYARSPHGKWFAERLVPLRIQRAILHLALHMHALSPREGARKQHNMVFMGGKAVVAHELPSRGSPA
jgi:hypothetical protein